MIDADDRELLLRWTIRCGAAGIGAGLAVLGSAVLLGTAWRLFDFARG